MAINNKVEITLANGVLDWYDDQSKAAYKLCRGTTLNKDHIVDVYDSTDKDVGYAQLTKVLTRLGNEVSNTNTYFICITGKGSEILATTTFQLNTYNIGNVVNTSSNYRFENEMRSELAAMKELIANNVQDEEEKPNTIGNFISGFSKNPEVVMAGIVSIFTIIKSFMKKDEPTIKTVTMAAGVPNETGTIEDYINILMQKGVGIDDFKKLSAMSESKIKNLLSFIR